MQILNKILKTIPFRLKWFLKRQTRKGNKYYCNICNSNIKEFLPGGINNHAIQKYEVIGAGYKQYDICPVCTASYRTRAIKLVMDKYINMSISDKVLHIAPEKPLFYLLKKKFNNNYIPGDIDPKKYLGYSNISRIDLTNMDFNDCEFDFILCNHVLEHIQDDEKALNEIHRVLKPSGLALLQVPISKKLKNTFENPEIISAEDRLVNYGQHDHVRIYAMDYVDKLEKTGFIVETISVKDLNRHNIFHKLMLDEREIIFVCRK